MSTEISSYEQKAIDFLKSTGTIFKADFLKFDYHFDSDDSKRNIFKITLKNSKGKYSFNFGSSIADSCEKVNSYSMFPKYTNRQSAIIVYPSPYDVLAALQKYEIGSFDDFCSEYSWFPINSSEDLRKAKKSYKSVLREWKNVERLFTPEQIEELQEIN